MVCTFFGHKDCFQLDTERLYGVLGELIQQGTDTIYVGNQGGFDSTVYTCLMRLRQDYPHIQVSVVLTYLPGEKREFEDHSDTVFPEWVELVHPRFAIDRRNRWMIEQADICVCYVNQTWGGAYKYVTLAHRRYRKIINLGNLKIGGDGDIMAIT